MRKITKISLWSAVILTLVVFSVFLWFKNCFMYGIDIDSRFSYSPDGKKIFFDALRNFKRNVYSVDADSFEIKQLTKSGWNYDPICSPDGSTITFISGTDDGGEVYIMNIDGSSQRRITKDRWDSVPAFSPDSSRIVFSRRIRNPDKTLYGDWVNVEAVYIVNRDGGEPSLVTIITCYPEQLRELQFLDAKTITFAAGVHRYTVDISGEKPRVSSTWDMNLRYPIFSPDGKKMAFAQSTQNYEDRQIFLADVDGKNPIQLTRNKLDNMVGYFFPNGKKILFVSFRRTSNANYALWEVNIDGSNLRRINFDLRKAK